MSGSFDKIEAQLNYDIVFAAQDFRDLVGNPSVRLGVRTAKAGSAIRHIGAQ
jgi:hypothetical protein